MWQSQDLNSGVCDSAGIRTPLPSQKAANPPVCSAQEQTWPDDSGQGAKEGLGQLKATGNRGRFDSAA